MFYSILFPARKQHSEPRQTDAPDCFKDLNLDQIFAPILKAKKEFKLEGFFYTALHDPKVILYRQDVMQELESDELRSLFAGFSKTVYDLGRYMDTIRKALTSNDSWNNNYLTRGHMLDYAERYCLTVSALSEGVSKLALRSAGLCGFAEYLQAYCASESYASLCAYPTVLAVVFGILPLSSPAHHRTLLQYCPQWLSACHSHLRGKLQYELHPRNCHPPGRL